ncbi:MAG: hypothetical protein K2X35_11830 [Bryobacteraceae bacterium]|nr:hypothetical protein [Bryobacteraceae bacterium]
MNAETPTHAHGVVNVSGFTAVRIEASRARHRERIRSRTSATPGSAHAIYFEEQRSKAGYMKRLQINPKWTIAVLVAITIPAVAVYSYDFLQEQDVLTKFDKAYQATPVLENGFTLITVMSFQHASGGPAAMVERRTLAVRGTERVELTENFENHRGTPNSEAPVSSLKRLSLAKGRLVLERPLLGVSHTMDIPNYHHYLSGRMDPASDCMTTLSGVKQDSYFKVGVGTFEGFQSITFQPVNRPGSTFTQVPALGCAEVSNDADSGPGGKSWNRVESFQRTVDPRFFVPRQDFREVDYLEGERLALAHKGRAYWSRQGADEAAITGEVQKALQEFDKQPPPLMQSHYLRHKAKSR